MTETQMRYTKYEKARMIGSRALQLAMGAPFLVKLDEKQLEAIHYNPIDIAKAEFDEGVIPITVRRPLPVRKKLKDEMEDDLVAEPDDIDEIEAKMAKEAKAKKEGKVPSEEEPADEE
ncbi:MAG TPA: DNA-directed RNA polymerase subunit K [Candidatus Nanoarchaeia archaeon]|nr:DNA-directed RNA polymerase subunit K [Candidatus Nanoarchaeia archaeon]